MTRFNEDFRITIEIKSVKKRGKERTSKYEMFDYSGDLSEGLDRLDNFVDEKIGLNRRGRFPKV